MSFAPPEAVLRVRRLGIEVPVLEGTSDATLNRGVGHIPGTALPGQSGNLAITGHRDGFFRPLKDVVPGDIVEVQRSGQTSPRRPTIRRQPLRRPIATSCEDTKIVFPADTSVLNKTAGSTLTLITCYPFYFVGAAPQRFIVQASLLPTAQQPSQTLPFNLSQENKQCRPLNTFLKLATLPRPRILGCSARRRPGLRRHLDRGLRRRRRPRHQGLRRQDC
jgi:hypothetical protein